MGWTLAGRSARACVRRIRVLVDQIRRSVSSVGRVFNPARHNYKFLDSTQPMNRLNPRLTLSVDRRTVMRSIWCVSLRRICNSFTATRRTTLGDRALILGDCCSSVECFSVVCSFCAIAAAVPPPRPQDGTVSVIVLFTIVSSCVTDCSF